MSRAFVKEVDDAPAPPAPDRPVSLAPNLVTPRGARLIEETIAPLETAIAEAGDEAHAAALRRDLRYWISRRASMRIVPPATAPHAVGFGVRATILRGDKTSDILIVGEDEAEPPAGRIAWTSPLARALEGAEPGETIDFAAGGRRETIEVVTVSPGGL
jgi:transcription elongation GreA/GreB family factor